MKTISTSQLKPAYLAQADLDRLAPAQTPTAADQPFAPGPSQQPTVPDDENLPPGAASQTFPPPTPQPPSQDTQPPLQDARPPPQDTQPHRQRPARRVRFSCHSSPDKVTGGGVAVAPKASLRSTTEDGVHRRRSKRLASRATGA
ncbi:uncharacterized protein LOC126265680 [Aethina tumida]|uniref:uncharacterized protein LOC126265680 n=1 Tax=Aethina tumida TaxID=116153 RepID=UPI0021475E49|nr:uncharacterized protein LOC126265680 [Aethina tumida]